MLPIDIDMDQPLDELLTWLDDAIARCDTIYRVRVPVLLEMERQNRKRMKFVRGHPDSLLFFTPPATFTIGSRKERYGKGLWISHPEFVFDYLIDYIMDGKV